MGTGLIFAAVIAVWVAYGVPLALRRHEEATRDGSITTFSSALRVLTHRRDRDDDETDAPATESRSLSPKRAAADTRDDETSADPEAAAPEAAEAEAGAPEAAKAEAGAHDAGADDTESAPVASDEEADATSDTERPAPEPAITRSRPRNRQAARLAARRRRRVLSVLLLATLVVGVLAATGVLLAWTPAIPAAIVVGWLVLCRVMVRHERGIARPSVRRTSERSKPAWRPRKAGAQHEGPKKASKGAAPDPDAELTVVLSGQSVDIDPHRKNVMEEQPLRDGDLDQQIVDAVPVTTTSGSTLWDPVPVTLPTYVTKPAARRTVRTVEFPSADASAADGESAADPSRRAVGD